MTKKVLVIGSGGREAAIAWMLQKSPGVQVFCAPGNAGIAQHAKLVNIKATDIDALLAFALENAIDLTIPGPEAPLVAGIVDRFRGEDLSILGPTAAAAQAEGSKAWFKKVLSKYKIPTASFAIFSDPSEALRYVEQYRAENIVIKADGLMGGKGVFLPMCRGEARRALDALVVPSTAGSTVVIEERLKGFERSVMAIVDRLGGYQMLPFTQDYKRLNDGDEGPNTGGMGAHTVVVDAQQLSVYEQLVEQVLHALAAAGCPYTGFLYLGIMETEDGPMILECNVRLGDPETQVILPSLEGDFYEVCAAASRDELKAAQFMKQVRHACCVVLASPEYPKSSTLDAPITGLVEAESFVDSQVFHAGTAKGPTGLWSDCTTGGSGRVLNLVGCGESEEMARNRAYQLIDIAGVGFPGMHYRRDISNG